MQRQLFASTRSCPFGCRYCFARFSDYHRPTELSVSALRPDCSIIYPNCDGELLLEEAALERLNTLATSLGHPAVISFSTKGRLGSSQVEKLSQIHAMLMRTGRGFLKVSLSFSTISAIPSIEPGTASLQQRLMGLELLVRFGIPRAITIKPLLPFIAIEEYQELVRLTRPFTDCFLLGDLYLDAGGSFVADLDPGLIGERRISWLSGQPVWPVVEDRPLKEALHSFINGQGGVAFDSDTDLVLGMLDRGLGGYHGSCVD